MLIYLHSISDINTVTLSGTLRRDVESYTKEDLVVSRFYLGVAESPRRRLRGNLQGGGL